MSPRIAELNGSSTGDVSTRLKQFEIKISDQKDLNNERFIGIEKELKEVNRRLRELEANPRNEEKAKGDILPDKLEERLRRLEDRTELMSNRLVDEKQLQMKIENFERMRKNTKEKNSTNFQEDILNEINNLYSVNL